MNAIAYIRVSTEDQELGIGAQRAQIQAYAERNGYTIVEWHEDRTSGTTDIVDRPGLTAAIAAVEACSARALLVAKRDRVARDTLIALIIDREVEKRGAHVLTADGTGNGNDPSDKLIRSILDAVAAFERAMIASRTKAALAVKKAKGERLGRPAYGWKVTDGVLVEDEAEQKKILAIRTAYAKGCKIDTIAKVIGVHHRIVKRVINE